MTYLYTALQMMILLAIYGGVPAAAAGGWVLFSQQKRPYSVSLRLSLIALALASLSGLVAACLLVYVRITGITDIDPRFPYQASDLGVLSALGSALFAVGGLWGRNPLRWYALSCSAGVFAFWYAAATGR